MFLVADLVSLNYTTKTSISDNEIYNHTSFIVL